VRLDFSSIIFPLTGETFCTGHEFILAMRLKCQIQILGGVYIPFQQKKNEKIDETTLDDRSTQAVQKKLPVLEPLLLELFQKYQSEKITGKSSKQIIEPSNTENKENNETRFFEVVKTIMDERLKYPKGSYMNLLYKFIANAGIGQMARGLNQKARYDSNSNTTKVLPAGSLISPLYAG